MNLSLKVRMALVVFTWMSFSHRANAQMLPFWGQPSGTAYKCVCSKAPRNCMNWPILVANGKIAFASHDYYIPPGKRVGDKTWFGTWTANGVEAFLVPDSAFQLPPSFPIYFEYLYDGMKKPGKINATCIPMQ